MNYFYDFNCCVEKTNYIFELDAELNKSNHIVPIHEAEIKGKKLALNAQDIATMSHLHLAFRHAPNSKRGQEECQNGMDIMGDAISLCGYRTVIPEHRQALKGEGRFQFLDKDDRKNYKNIQDIAGLVQLYNEQIKTFINVSMTNGFFNFDSTHIFIVLSRQDGARSPYDLNSYPLGKCGSRRVVHKDFYFGIKITSSKEDKKYEQEINAVFQTFIEKIKLLTETYSQTHALDIDNELKSIDEVIREK